MSDGLIAGISNEDYHADPAISSSALKYALKCPAMYKAYIDGKLPNKSTPAMDLGSVVHALVLEPETIDDVAVVAPIFSGKGSVAARAEFKAEHDGKIVLSEDDWAKCAAMASNVVANQDVAAILAESQNELSGWYDDPMTGLRCRYRPDIRTDWIIGDLKTCQDPSPAGFSRAIENFGYAISAAHYLLGDEKLMGSDHKQFAFICVESAPPYLTATYILDQEDLAYGASQRARALATIKNCTETGVWPGYGGGVFTYIGVPFWAKKSFLEGEI